MPPIPSDHQILFTAALGLTPPWELVSVKFDASPKRIVL